MPAPRIRKAVFPVAGMGTRFLPATKAIPKEMLPVVDKPVIQYGVEEAREAGIEQFIFVTGRGKHVIEDHFDHAYELESLLSAREKTKELQSLLESLPNTGAVSFTRQQKPLGLGHAVLCAQHLVGNEPFAVVLPDDLMVGQPGALKQMVDAYCEIGGGVIVAAEEKPREETQRYGVIAPGPIKGPITEVHGIVEKPKPSEAPSNLCVIGRYILPRRFSRNLSAANAARETKFSSRMLWRVFSAVFPSTPSRQPACAMTAATKSDFFTPILPSDLSGRISHPP